MLKILIAACSLLLAGCVTSAHLVAQDGKRHPMEFNQSGRKVTADIDGTKYSGIYAPTSGGASAGFVGTKMMYAVSDSNFGQAMLTAKTGDILNCDFMVASGPTVLGQCKSKSGQEYMLTTD